MGTKTTNNQTNKINAIHQRDEIELLGFLCSLPWAQGTTVSMKPAIKEYQGESDDGIIRIELCLNMEGNKPSPRFESLKKLHGTTIGYHGTKIDRVWSILNYGLLSFSESTLYASNG